MINKTHKGFTLIELLVVIAIIGLLSTLAVVALNNARQKSRDAKRVADVKQLATALELYFADQNGYPSQATALTLGAAETSDCLDEDGLDGACDDGGSTYMGLIPAAPTPPTGNVYTYCSATAAAPGTCAASTESFIIGFTLEGATGGLAAGARTATPEGLK
jgi:prepilin-type N-terminal cleavage/methylation domain-containing protein